MPLPTPRSSAAPTTSEEFHPARQALLEALQHALMPNLKGIFEASPGRSVAVAFLSTSLNSFLPPLSALRYTATHSTER